MFKDPARAKRYGRAERGTYAIYPLPSLATRPIHRADVSDSVVVNKMPISRKNSQECHLTGLARGDWTFGADCLYRRDVGFVSQEGCVQIDIYRERAIGTTGPNGMFSLLSNSLSKLDTQRWMATGVISLLHVGGRTASCPK